MAQWHVWAEHQGGGSVGHPCAHGIYSDPADDWEAWVEARDEDEAREKGESLLADYVEENYAECRCRRREKPGTEGWWRSVSVLAERDQQDLQDEMEHVLSCCRSALADLAGELESEACRAEDGRKRMLTAERLRALAEGARYWEHRAAVLLGED